jgi:membrane protein DedA with SNARE-associated domain
MPLAFDFFLHFAYFILFLWVMAEQLGVPVPSLPLLLAAGTLTATHKLSLPLVLLAVVAGCFVSDSLWYLLGKRFGGAMVKLVCRLSFESQVGRAGVAGGEVCAWPGNSGRAYCRPDGNEISRLPGL